VVVGEPVSVTSSGGLKLTNEMIVRLLVSPVVNQIVSQIEQVVKRTVPCSYLLLAGGFTECDLLKNAIQRRFENQMKVLRPPHASLAVLRGAVMFGLKPTIIQSRIVKNTYGIAMSCRWNVRKHLNRTKVWFKQNGILIAYCSEVFNVFARKGERVEFEQTVCHVFKPVTDDQVSMSLSIYEAKIDQPSYVTDPGCACLAQVILQMPDLRGNLDRSVLVTMRFGDTHIELYAFDQTSGKDIRSFVKYLDVLDVTQLPPLVHSRLL